MLLELGAWQDNPGKILLYHLAEMMFSKKGRYALTSRLGDDLNSWQ